MSETKAIDLYREITGASEAQARNAYMFLEIRQQTTTSSLSLDGLDQAEQMLSKRTSSPPAEGAANASKKQ